MSSNPSHRKYKFSAFPVKLVFYVLETNEGTWIPDFVVEVYLFGILFRKFTIKL